MCRYYVTFLLVTKWLLLSTSSFLHTLAKLKIVIHQLNDSNLPDNMNNINLYNHKQYWQLFKLLKEF